MHFLTLVLVPASTRDLAAAVDAVLRGETAAHYEDFQAQCSCHGRVAWSAGFSAFKASVRGQRLFRELERASASGAHHRHSELCAERDEAVRALAATRADFGRVDPGCDVCGGTGTYLQSRNPTGHMDHWQIGGRWSGLLGRDGPDPDRHAVPVGELPADLGFVAVVTPEEGYFEDDSWSGQLGEQQVLARRRLWNAQVAALLSRHPDDLAVVVDAHF